ncbi:MAG: hypothetical protein AAFY71_19995 [Bacteroidota bacterium]
MKKRRNIILVIISLLFLGVTLYSLMSGWGMEDAAQVSSPEQLLEKAVGMIQQNVSTQVLP